MSSVIDPQPEHPAHEELVAYLDGELAPEECRRVEERLAKDEEYRQQLRDLDQAWEALDALPTTTVDDGFARTTIELACVAAEEDLSQRTHECAVEIAGVRGGGLRPASRRLCRVSYGAARWPCIRNNATTGAICR